MALPLKYTSCPCGEVPKVHGRIVAIVTTDYGDNRLNQFGSYPVCENHVQLYANAKYKDYKIDYNLQKWHENALANFRVAAREYYHGDEALAIRQMTHLWEDVEREKVTLETSDFLEMAQMLTDGKHWSDIRQAIGL